MYRISNYLKFARRSRARYLANAVIHSCAHEIKDTIRSKTMTATSASSTRSSGAVPWVERYRPRALDEVSHQKEVVQALKNAVETNRLPHLLFYGKPGTGKTSVALALCRQLWHPSQLRSRVLELNASDERGISVVRDKIKHFAGLAVGDGNVGNADGGAGQSTLTGRGTLRATSGDGEEQEALTKYPNPPYKIIILDEADTVTPDAQSALRRIIEAHSRITRFILICNYVTRIIEPLASRCAKFRFQPLPPHSMKQRLQSIAIAESCVFEEGKGDEAIDSILELSEGDMRRAVTMLQSAHTLTGRGSKEPIRAAGIAEMAGIPPPGVMNNFVTSLRSNAFATMERAVNDTIAEGYSVPLILSMLAEIIINDDSVSDVNKARLSIRIAEADKNLVDGAHETLQLMSVGSMGLRCLAPSSSGR